MDQSTEAVEVFDNGDSVAAASDERPPDSSRKLTQNWRLWALVAAIIAAAAGWAAAVHYREASERNRAANAASIAAKESLQNTLRTTTVQRENEKARGDRAEARVTELEATATELESRERELSENEAALKSREAKVTAQELVQAAQTISEGSWAVGVDVQAGTYRTRVAVVDSCYWEINSDPNGSDILANDNVSGGRPTVKLSKGQFFTTNRCGEWVRV